MRFVLAAAVLAGCSSADLTEAGRHVVYTDSTLDVSGCDEVGVVETSNTGRAAAITELRNAAAAKGGTHVLVEGQSRLTRGTAYKCP